MSTLLTGAGLETVTAVGIVAAAAITFITWCALRINGEVDRAETLGLVRRRRLVPVTHRPMARDHPE